MENERKTPNKVKDNSKEIKITEAKPKVSHNKAGHNVSTVRTVAKTMGVKAAVKKAITTPSKSTTVTNDNNTEPLKVAPKEEGSVSESRVSASKDASKKPLIKKATMGQMQITKRKKGVENAKEAKVTATQHINSATKVTILTDKANQVEDAVAKKLKTTSNNKSSTKEDKDSKSNIVGDTNTPVVKSEQPEVIKEPKKKVKKIDPKVKDDKSKEEDKFKIQEKKKKHRKKNKKSIDKKSKNQGKAKGSIKEMKKALKEIYRKFSKQIVKSEKKKK